MTPRLTPQGHPVGRRRRPAGGVRLYWCSCDNCSNEITFHPLTQAFAKGRAVRYKEHLQHSKIQREKQRDEPQPTSSPPSLSASSSRKGSPEASQHPQSLPSPADIAANTRLCEIEADLRQWKASMLHPLKDLVFIDPPSPTSEARSLPLEPFSRDEMCNELSSGPYALAFERQVNRPILEYLLNLHDTLLELDGMTLGDAEDLRHKRKALVNYIEGEFNRIESAKAEEWERQKARQDRARSIWRNGNIIVVDTGESFFMKAVD